MLGPRERGAAVVDFVLILMLLIPLFLGIFQVGLVLYTRNTATACASEGARYGANFDRTPADGRQRAADCIKSSLSSKWTSNVTAGTSQQGGLPMVVVNADTTVPALGLWGSLVKVDTTGHAVKETP
jgi:Flp pilus assembly protein TadG